LPAWHSGVPQLNPLLAEVYSKAQGSAKFATSAKRSIGSSATSCILTPFAWYTPDRVSNPVRGRREGGLYKEVCIGSSLKIIVAADLPHIATCSSVCLWLQPQLILSSVGCAYNRVKAGYSVVFSFTELRFVTVVMLSNVSSAFAMQSSHQCSVGTAIKRTLVTMVGKLVAIFA
jgi:hypothetical protein